MISGINAGANLGHDVTYSGTATAVMKAVIFSVPGVAVSLAIVEGFIGEVDYGPVARRVVVSIIGLATTRLQVCLNTVQT